MRREQHAEAATSHHQQTAVFQFDHARFGHAARTIGQRRGLGAFPCLARVVAVKDERLVPIAFELSNSAGYGDEQASGSESARGGRS